MCGGRIISFLTLIRQGSEQVSRLCRKSTDNIEDAFDNVTNLVAFGMGASVKRCLFLHRANYIECGIFAWECEFIMQIYEVFNKDGYWVRDFYDDYPEAEQDAYDFADKIDGRVVVCWQEENTY